MACPENLKVSEDALCADEEKKKMLYGEYLMLDKVLNAQRLLSTLNNTPAYDEHLFIVIHQTYELWFKQIIYELDFVREKFASIMEDWHCFEVLKRLNRIVAILRLLVDQVPILETMTPIDFGEFRRYLNTASGFQSLQFRIIENKLGLRHEHRAKFNQNYLKVFDEDEISLNTIEKSETEHSLLVLLQNWLERTPGLESNGFDFWTKFQHAVCRFLEDEALAAEVIESQCTRDHKTSNLSKKKELFDSILNSDVHDALESRGDRKLSHKAIQGAIMITLYKDELIFMTPYQILSLLIDIDSLIAKWRYSHILLVQRMIGTLQVGTGGSSGYQYLRSTLSDRYKVFIDLCNVATFTIPRKYLPPLSTNNRTLLSTKSCDFSSKNCCCSWGTSDTSAYNTSSEDEKKDLESSLDTSI